ncbi:MAG: hypothetical protein IJD46_01055 [Bacilli bacterium]|nr:hypothetical protein [Bacilli bacterium]
MIVKMYQVLEFENFYNKIKDIKMPIKLAYKFSKLMREIDNERFFYQNKLQSIIEAYGEKDNDGNFVLTQDKSGVQIKKEDLEKCQKEVMELSNLDVEINGIEISINELENFELTLQDMNILMGFIKE